MQITDEMIEARARIAALEAENARLKAEVERLEKADETRAQDISRLTIERDEARDRLAELGAAAPDLLDVLQQIVSDKYVEKLGSLKLRAQRAIARATGAYECATEGCAKTATVRFERGGVGSDYCYGCYMRIQALTAAQEAGKP